MSLVRCLCSLGLLGCMWLLPVTAAQALVLASIEPLRLVLTDLMAGVDKPQVLLPGPVNPHQVALKPSDLKLLHQADWVLWIGPSMEGFLHKPLERLAPEHQLALQTLALNWRHYGAQGHHHAGESKDLDPHIWLDPLAMARLSHLLLPHLQRLYPKQHSQLAANQADFVRRLTEMDQQLQARFGPLQQVPFLIYHDSLGYWNARYRLQQAGVINPHPEQPLSLKRLRQLQQRIEQAGIQCVFTEPQYPDRVLDKLFAEGQVRWQTLDLLGGQPPLPSGYLDLLSQLADAMQACLAPAAAQ